MFTTKYSRSVPSDPEAGGYPRNEGTPPAGGRSPGLVIHAKSSSAFDKPDGFDPAAARLERFALQSAARKILPDSRTAGCLRYRQKGAQLQVWRSVEHGSAHYKGLQTCGSVWACPICASKISERRRGELLSAIQGHEAAGGQVLLLNLTNPHKAGDSLPVQLNRQTRAINNLLGGSRAAQKLRKEIGLVGTVRAWEVTYGENGFHPHFHILLFVKKGLDLVEIEGRFFSLWARGCELAGLPAPQQKRCPLLDGSHAAEYASKGVWGLDREMTKGHTKKSRKGYSPFDLLRAFAFDVHPQNVSVQLTQDRARFLFGIYAEAFKGRRQLVWSKGLKEHFRIEDRSDTLVAVAAEADSVLLGMIELEDWRRIVQAEGRGLVLELARNGGWDAVRTYISSLHTPGGRLSSIGPPGEPPTDLAGGRR